MWRSASSSEASGEGYSHALCWSRGAEHFEEESGRDFVVLGVRFLGVRRDRRGRHLLGERGGAPPDLALALGARAEESPHRRAQDEVRQETSLGGIDAAGEPGRRKRLEPVGHGRGLLRPLGLGR